MAVVSLIVAILALVVAGLGTYLTNKRATEALRDVRDARVQLAWNSAIAAVNRMMVDPTTTDVTKPLQDMRITLQALADALPDWKNFDHWLAAEHVLAPTLLRQVQEGYNTPAATADEAVERMQPVISWVHGFSGNLRHLRNNGFRSAEVSELQEHARELTREIHTRHGWPLPPDQTPGLKPLR